MKSAEIENKVYEFTSNYVKTAVDTRVDDFVEKNFKNFKKIAEISVKYGLKDLGVNILNFKSWTSSKILKKDYKKRLTTKEKLISDAFINEVFKPEEFMKEYKRFFYNNFFSEHSKRLLELQKRLEDVGRWNNEEFNNELINEINKWCSSSEASSKTVVMATEILVGTFLAGEIGKGFGATGGSIAANSIYISQLGFFSSIWAGIFGAPAWVGFIGAGVGGTFAFIIISPFIGAIVERIANQIINIKKKIKDSEKEIVTSIVNGEIYDSEESLFKKTVDGLDVVTEAVDNIIFVAGKIT